MLKKSAKHKILRLVSSVMVLVSCLAFAPSIFGQESSDSKFEIGFAKHVRLGHWSSLSIDASTLPTQPHRYEVSCLDGDGNPVMYAGELRTDSLYPNTVQALFRAGRAVFKADVGTGSIKVRLLSAEGQLIDETSYPSASDFVALESTENVVLSICTDDSFNAAIGGVLSNMKPEPVLIQGLSPAHLPLTSRGYQSVDQLFLATNDAKVIKSIGKQRLTAILRWVEQGGHLILSTGQRSAKLLAKGQLLGEFCPGEFAGEVELEGGGRLKAYADTQDELIGRDQSINIVNITDPTGVVRLADSRNPVVIEKAVGLGRVSFIAADLLSDEFKNWTGTQNLIKKAVYGVDEDNNFVKQSGGRVSHFGYKDLVGQLRVPLDQFSKVRFVTFTWVAVLIALFIICIGPADYFLLRKVFKKMELTWLTFGLMTAAFCGLAWFTVNSTKPDTIQVNQLEIIDMNAVSGSTNGKVWINLFSPKTQPLDIDIEKSNKLGFEMESTEVTWQGLPGKGLGGMSSTAPTAIAGESYRVEIEGDKIEDGNVDKVHITDFPMRVSSTKPVFATWAAPNPTRLISRLKYTARNDRNKKLEGTLTNPLDKQLKNCRIIFEDWVYVLERPLDPGETVDIVTETREKNARSYFGRRTTKDDKGANEVWNPTDTRINRIAEIMMFYDAAGGRTYTGLTHEYQSDVDLSHTPYLNRAILVGELAEQTTGVLIDGQSLPDSYDQHLTILRVIFPVQKKK